MRRHEGLGIGNSLGRSGIDAGFSFYEQLSQRVSEVGKDEVDACMTCPTVLVPSWTNNAKQALDPCAGGGRSRHGCSQPSTSTYDHGSGTPLKRTRSLSCQPTRESVFSKPTWDMKADLIWP